MSKIMTPASREKLSEAFVRIYIKRRSLSENQERTVIQRYVNNKESMATIAKDFGIHELTVRNTLRRYDIARRTWRESKRVIALDTKAFDTLTPESKYWIGFLLADGSINSGRTVQVMLKESDQNHLVNFKQFLKSNHEIKRVESRPGYFLCNLAIGSMDLVESLARYGIHPNKTYSARVSHEGLQLDCNFWRGVIDGDGTIGEYKDSGPRIGLVGTYEVLESFIAFVNTFARTKATPRPNNTIWQVNFSKTIALKILSALYSNCGVALDRKKSLALEILQRNYA